ncbi:MAG: sulfotransferase [Steroidobacteraceae bacterium]
MPASDELMRAINEARAAARAGRLADARTILEGAARAGPVNDSFFLLYLDVLEAQRDWRALAGAAGTWLRFRPDGLRAAEAQARAAWETGLLHEAIELYERVMALGGRHANRLATFGRLCLNALEFERAGRAFDECESLDRDNAHMLAAKAGLLAFEGRFAEAEAYCRRCLARNPGDVAAYRLLGQLQDGRLAPEERAVLAGMLERPGVRVEHRITAAFALGDSLDAEGDIDAAFAAYGRAQAFARARGREEHLEYQPERTELEFDELVRLFASGPLEVPPLTGDVARLRPIFIIGMPRSGTTLVEGVLGAHTRVRACGERMVMRQVKREYLALVAASSPLTAELRTNFVRACTDQLPDLGAADHYTDKNPWNFDAVGLILTLFPDAHVVHVRRNPIETGLSIYCHEFTKFQPFTQRLDHIGHYYGQYARLMSHWERVAGDRMTTIQYEAFAADLDRTAPALLRACGLEWEDGCRTFQRSGNVIATLSAIQVRRPVSPRSGRVRRYERHLGPLVEALEAAGVDLETGAVRPDVRR